MIELILILFINLLFLCDWMSLIVQSCIVVERLHKIGLSPMFTGCPWEIVISSLSNLTIITACQERLDIKAESQKYSSKVQLWWCIKKSDITLELRKFECFF